MKTDFLTFLLVAVVGVLAPSSLEVVHGQQQRQCPRRSDPCMTDKNRRECKQLLRNGCKKILQLEKCPLEFRCGDYAPQTAPVRPPSQPVPRPVVSPPQYRPVSTPVVSTPVSAPSPCPARDAQCMTDELYERCLALVRNGCKNIVALLSCPYSGFGCLDETSPVVPPPRPAPVVSTPRMVMPVMTPSRPSQCPPINAPCMNEENYNKCQDYLADGCREIIVREQCPLVFGCA